MGRRRRRSQFRAWGTLFGIVLGLAVVAVVVEILRSFWWAFLVAGTLVAIVWILRRPEAGASWTALRARPAPRTGPLRAPASAAYGGRTVFHTVRTERGEMVRSRAEARIANSLHRRGIDYRYEPEICGFRPDFYLPRWNLLIEYWGLDTPEYRERRRVKTAAYFAKGYKLISLEPAHYSVLEEELTRKLYYFDQDIYERAKAA